MTWILKEIKATGGGKISQRKCVEGQKKDRSGILEKTHVQGRENTQRKVKDVDTKRKGEDFHSRWEYG